MRELTTKSGKLVRFREVLNYKQHKALFTEISEANMEKIQNLDTSADAKALLETYKFADALIKAFVLEVKDGDKTAVSFEQYEEMLNQDDVLELVGPLTELIVPKSEIKKN